MGESSPSHLLLAGFVLLGMLVQVVALIVYMRTKLDSLSADVKEVRDELRQSVDGLRKEIAQLNQNFIDHLSNHLK